MSFIFGKYNINKNELPSQQLTEMQNELNHWDADDSGLWQNDYIGLGHLMLWNTPESLNEKQPYKNAITQNIITADARIDNRKELFRALNIADQSIPDSQLILKAYEKWGNDCVKHFYGDFAFVIWNSKKEELFCARDHMGVKSLFYHHDNEAFIFSTAVQGLTSFKNVSIELKENFDYALLCFIRYDYNKSVYKHIHLLPPANYAVINKDGIKLQEYWSFDASRSITYKNDQDYVEHFKELFNEAIETRIRTAFPLGAHLSGGLDSTGIVAYGLPFIKQKNLEFHTYGLTMAKKHHGVEWPYKDERAVMELAKEHLGVKNLHFVDLEGRNYLEDAIALERLGGGPYTFATALLNLNTADNVAKQGVRTVLSGGFGNYGVSWKWNNYEELFVQRKWLKLLRGLSTDKGNPVRNIARFFRDAYRPKPKDVLNTEILNLFDADYKKGAADYMTAQFGRKRFDSYGTKERQIEFIKRARPRRYQDNLVSISNKVEFRYPLGDVRLLEYFIALPDSQKYNKGVNRLLFRKVLGEKLPEYVTWKYKSNVYSVPQSKVHFKQSFDKVELFLKTAYEENNLGKLDYKYVKIALERAKEHKYPINYQALIYKIIHYTIYQSKTKKYLQ